MTAQSAAAKIRGSWMLTISHQGARAFLAFDDTTVQLWTSVDPVQRLGTWPRTAAGATAAVAELRRRDPQASELPAPGRRWAPPTTPAQPGCGFFTRVLSGNPRHLICLGGVALAAAPFLAWLRVDLLGSLSLFDLYSLSRTPPVLPSMLAFSGALLAMCGWGRWARWPLRTTANTLGIAAALLGSGWTLQVLRAVSGSHGFAGIGPGPFCAAGGVVAVLAGANRGAWHRRFS